MRRHLWVSQIGVHVCEEAGHAPQQRHIRHGVHRILRRPHPTDAVRGRQQNAGPIRRQPPRLQQQQVCPCVSIDQSYDLTMPLQGGSWWLGAGSWAAAVLGESTHVTFATCD